MVYLCHNVTKKPRDMSSTEFSQTRIMAGLTIKETATLLGYTIRQIYRFEEGSTYPRKHVLQSLNSIINKQIDDETPQFSFIDLFAGIGGLRLSFESIGGKCIYTSEIDKYAVQTYTANFHDQHEIIGDITKVHETTIPDHDVLLAGFPCQPFSVAGVSKNISLGRKHGFAAETQGTLFFDIVRILHEKRPPAFVLENVKNLKGHDKGRTFKIIMNILEQELGYHVYTKIIDAQYFVPQHRERIVIVGFREDVNFSWDDLNIPTEATSTLADILHTQNGEEETDDRYTTGISAEVCSKYTLTDKLWLYLQEYAKKHKAKGNGFGFGLVNKDNISRTLSARYFKDGSEILIDQGPNINPRRLTPRECARLMGFDDKFKIVTSDTQAYKQFGNSVVIPLFKEVARIMKPHIAFLSQRPVEYQSSFNLIS